MISDIVDLISEDVKLYLLSKGVNWNNFINFMAKVRDVSGLTNVEFASLMSEAGKDIAHPFWQEVIFWSRQGRFNAIPGAEFLGVILLALVVGALFYTGGKAASRSYLREIGKIVDEKGAVAEQEAFNTMVELLQRALSSGRWQLRKGWTARDAMLKILINMQTNRPPGFLDILEAVDDGPAAVSSGPRGLTLP